MRYCWLLLFEPVVGTFLLRNTCLMKSLLAFLMFGLSAVATAETFSVAEDQSLVGQTAVITAVHEDTLSELARTHELGYESFRLANPDVDLWLPGEGTEIVLPKQYLLPNAPRKGIVINVAEYRMYYFDGDANGKNVSTFPVSIGRQEWLTPLGSARVVSKVEKPTWRPTASILEEYAERGEPLEKVVPPGPDNPLGDYAMRLSLPSYLIHGTNKPSGVGMRVTHGCVRMYPENIAWLFPQVAINTPVTIVNQPYKFGFQDGVLYFEAHQVLEPPEDEAAQSFTRVMEAFVKVVDPQQTQVDWDALEDAWAAPTGMPVQVGRLLD